MRQCPNCDTVFTKVPKASDSCPNCENNDYSDYFSQGSLQDVNLGDLLANGADVSMCPKCLLYTRELATPSEDELAINGYSTPKKCPMCDSEMIKVHEQ